MKAALNKNVLYIVLTFDAENDFFFMLNKSRLKDTTRFSWRGVEKGIPTILKVLREHEDSFGNRPKATWFVRVDGSLKKAYGDEGYLFAKYSKVWKSLVSDGHEIGFHPHLYRPYKGAWIQETRKGHLAEKLNESYKAMAKHGFSPTSSRIGETYMTNEIMATLTRLGIKIDSTAVPGRLRKDSIKNIDWRGTPQTPYRPSRTNYRVPSNKPLDIVEVPMTTVKTKVEYDKRPLKRYVNLSFHHKILRRGVSAHIKSNYILTTVTHTSEILPELAGGKVDPLISFDSAVMRKNLNFIINECLKANRKYKFIRLADVLDLIG
jgi:hypothetical protein